MTKTIRVFPRRTRATPDDDDAYIGGPTLFVEADKVVVSCTFTWDKPEAERLAEAWKCIAPTELGGPAYGDPGGEFEPGKFLKDGYTITSRGCTNRCWFCYVWKRTGGLRELEIKDGWIVADDNLLACSKEHILRVFKMLQRQKEPISFTGGIEAKLLEGWHIDKLLELRLRSFYCAYDTEDDYDPLKTASKMLFDSGLIRKSSHKAGCYCLIGYPGDTFDNAEKRLKDVMGLGFIPFAMLYRDNKGEYKKEWRRFQRSWSRPAAIFSHSSHAWLTEHAENL